MRHTSSFCHKVVEELFEKLRAWERMMALAEEPQGMVPSFAAGAMADIFRMLISTVSLWFVWVRFGSRSVNEPEIGSVSVCIPTVCFVESKLIDANCLHMPY